MEVTVPYNGSASRRVPKQREKQDIENKIIAEAIAKTSSRLIAAKKIGRIARHVLRARKCANPATI